MITVKEKHSDGVVITTHYTHYRYDTKPAIKVTDCDRDKVLAEYLGSNSFIQWPHRDRLRDQ